MMTAMPYSTKMIPANVKAILMQLCAMLYFANDQTFGQWSSQSDGFYGHVLNAIGAALQEVYGEEITRRCMSNLEFGRSVDWYGDLMLALKEGFEEQAEADSMLLMDSFGRN